jgi:large subunit ribosomal protein L11
MGEKKTIDSLIEGGKATAGPPLGPALGPLGVNVLQIVNKINDLTNSYAGMRVPVKITIDVDTKGFEVEVGTPTTSALIVKELNIEKGSGTAGTESVGNLTQEQVINIAKMKITDSFASNIKNMAKEVLGTCVSMGVTVEDSDPREIQKKIDEGEWDKVFKEGD